MLNFQRTDLSMEDPSLINLESSMDQSQQSSNDNVSNKVSPIESKTTHVLKTSQLVIPTLQELGFTKSGKCEVLENVEPKLVSGGNGNEETENVIIKVIFTVLWVLVKTGGNNFVKHGNMYVLDTCIFQLHVCFKYLHLSITCMFPNINII
jgi:hypothetical protein